LKKTFVSIIDTFSPKEDGKNSGCFISKSMDASTHFETTAQEALDMYEKITGKAFDLSKTKEQRDKERNEKKNK